MARAHEFDQLHQRMNVLNNPRAVPDAPFKDTWSDLALKKNLYDTAADPDLNWLGMTNGKTQADRYDLSKQLSKIEWSPRASSGAGLPDGHHPGILEAYNHAGDKVIHQYTTSDKLPDHIGKEGARALFEHGAPQGPNPFSNYEVTPSEVEPGAFDVTVNGHYIGTDPAEEGAHQLGQSRVSDAVDERPYVLEGQNLTVGGEGMLKHYDEVYPNKLAKLLKPFGGSVEKGEVQASYDPVVHYAEPELNGAVFRVDPYTSATRGVDQHVASVWPRSQSEAQSVALSDLLDTQAKTNARTGVPAFLARLTPEMKAAIVKKGFPLMSLGGLIAAQPGEVDKAP